MSWDISIQDLPADAKSVGDIPAAFRPKSLGRREKLIARIHEVIPEVDFSDPSWGILEGPGFSIEFNMGSETICDGFMLHIRGDGNVSEIVARLLQHLQLRGIDCQTSEFLSVETAQGSFDEWQAYPDRVIGTNEGPEGEHPPKQE